MKKRLLTLVLFAVFLLFFIFPKVNASPLRTNEPSGYAALNNINWSDRPSYPTSYNGWIDDSRNAGTAITIVSDSTAPISPPNVADGIFPQGASGGSAPFYVWYPFSTSNISKLYVSFAIRFSPNWTNNGNAGTKVFFFGTKFNQNTQVYLGLNGNPVGDLQFYLQGTPGGNRDYLGENLASTSITAGVWYNVELLMQMNTNGTADGIFDMWVNGVHTGHYTDMHYADAPNNFWYSMQWNPTYGGGSNPVPQKQDMYIDDIYTSAPFSNTTPPVISNGQPSGTLAAGTTSTTLSITTNEQALCKYSTTPNTPYLSMTTRFTTADRINHVTGVISGLQNGQSYNYYIRCNDTSGNIDTSDYSINFSVSSSATSQGGGQSTNSGGGGGSSGGGSSGGSSGGNSSNTTAPVISNGQPSGTLAAGTTSTTMSVTTNETTVTSEIGTLNLTPANPGIFSNFAQDTGIQQVELNVNSEVSNVTVTVSQYGTQPSAVPVQKTGNVYEYLHIEPQNTGNSVSSATVTFNVNKTWINENNISIVRVVLFKFYNDSNSWEQLQTNYTGSDSEHYSYTAEVPGFSYFAIGEATQSILSENIPFGLVVIILVAIILIILIMILVIRNKRRQYYT